MCPTILTTVTASTPASTQSRHKSCLSESSMKSFDRPMSAVCLALTRGAGTTSIMNLARARFSQGHGVYFASGNRKDRSKEVYPAHFRSKIQWSTDYSSQTWGRRPDTFFAEPQSGLEPSATALERESILRPFV